MMVQMMQNDDDHALILEDDVDFEWTFRDTWRELFPSLKNNWAIVCVALLPISSLVPCLALVFPQLRRLHLLLGAPMLVPPS